MLVKEVLLFYGVGLLSGVGLSLLELLNVKWQHTEQWLLNLLGEFSGWCAAVVSGLVDSKEIFSVVEMLYIYDALIRGVAIFKLSHSHTLHLLV